MTFCNSPQWNTSVDPYLVTNIDQICPDGSDYKVCFDDLVFSQEAFILGIIDFSLGTGLSVETQSEFLKPAPRNIFHSQCYTYDKPVSRKAEGNAGYIILFNGANFDTRSAIHASPHNRQEMTWIAHKISLHASNFFRGYFLQNFLLQMPPQHFSNHFPEPYHFSMMTIKATKRIDMVTKQYQCESDPNYNIQHCQEQYVIRKLGCASPWDNITVSKLIGAIWNHSEWISLGS